MPTDPATLEKLGLRDIPRWYRDKYGLKSIISADTRNSRPELARCWRPDFRVPAMPLGSTHDLPPPRYILGGVGDSQARMADGLSQYHPVASAFPSLQGAYFNNSAVPDVPIISTSSTSSEDHPNVYGQAPANHRSSGESQPWRKLDLLSQDLPPEYPILDPILNPFRSELESGAQNFRAHDIPDPNDCQTIAQPVVSNLLRPAFNIVGDADVQKTAMDGEVGSKSHGQLSVSVSKTTSSSSWPMSDSRNDDLAVYSGPLFQPMPSVTGSHTQLESPKGKQRSRRLYQPRVIVDVSADGVPGGNESTAAATDRKDFSPTQMQGHNSCTIIGNKHSDIMSSHSSPISSPRDAPSVHSHITAWIPGSRSNLTLDCTAKGKNIKAGVKGRYGHKNFRMMGHEGPGEVYFADKSGDDPEQGTEHDLLGLSLNEVRPSNGRC